VNDLWSERAEAYRTSTTHMRGDDLEALVVMCEPGEGVKALDVATGGGHVARRLREAGCEVVTVDSSPGMQPDVLSRAEHLPFDDGSFDVVTCRIAAHHFPDIAKAVAEMARVARRWVLVSVPREPLWRGLNMARGAYLKDFGNTPGHINHWSKRSFISMLSRHGTVEEVRSPFPWTMVLVRVS